MEFIKHLENYLKKEDNKFNKFEKWCFSKLDESLDEIYIPYYNLQVNGISKFRPDFIFWLKKGNDYFIVFVDPKGIEHTAYENKVDGYKYIFEDNNGKKEFSKDNLKVKVYLFLFTEDVNRLPEGYKQYWFDNFENILEKIL